MHLVDEEALRPRDSEQGPDEGPGAHLEPLPALCVERIGDAARILEAQNEVLYAEEWKLSEIPVVGTMQAD
ncbi:hypothetical protein ACTQZF_04320 [Collinsella sp. LCP19S3_H3]|uniref:hypothetical protein n=1 Tax=Collinsella sp. LCP19S3_H3 TaxID=3438768 RepID=UPI003F8DB01E